MGFGGIERSLIEFLRDLDYARYDVDLLLLYGPFDMCGDINSRVNLINAENLTRKIRIHPFYILLYGLAQFFKVFSCNKLFSHFNNLKKDFLYRKLYRRHCRKHYDTVIAYQQGFACEYTARYVSANKKIMMYHHGEIQDKEYLEPWFNQTDILLTVSEGIAQKLAEAFPYLKERISFIQNFESVEFIHKKASEYIPVLDQDKFNLCTCGRISHEKGFDLALETAVLLRKIGLNFHWYFVGGGYDTYEQSIRQKIVALHLSDHITITGFIANPFPYINCCNVLVVPSRFEAYPLIIFEAKALCKTIVSTATDGALKLLSHKKTGYICGFTPSEISEAIMEIYDSATLQDIIIRNLQCIDYKELKDRYYKQWYELL